MNEKNIRKAATGHRDEEGPWYGLDGAGVIMPAVSNAVETSLFRISAELHAPLYLPALQEALDNTAARFPYLVVDLRRGFFWHYLAPHAGPLLVRPDSGSPCQDLDPHRRGTCLIRVRARGRTLACEFSHIVTDGTGGIRFLKNLLVEYFRLTRGRASEGARPSASADSSAGSPGSDPDLYRLNEAPDPGEFEDAYNRHFPGDYPFPAGLPSAFHLPSDRLPRGRYRVIRGLLSLREALALSRDFHVSLTELLAAAFLEALQGIWTDESAKGGRRPRPRLAVQIPVNMRKFFPTPSNRNFSLFVLVTQDMRLGPRDFPDILSRVHHELRYETDARTIARQIARNVSGTRQFLLRLVPLFLKDPLFRIFFSVFGADILSGFISNLGAVKLPDEFASRIERFDFIPTPSLRNKTNASVLSWGDALVVDFGSLAVSRELERRFFVRLRKLGLQVRVDSFG
jgi:hypothetical protein